MFYIEKQRLILYNLCGLIEYYDDENGNELVFYMILILNKLRMLLYQYKNLLMISYYQINIYYVIGNVIYNFCILT